MKPENPHKLPFHPVSGEENAPCSPGQTGLWESGQSLPIRFNPWKHHLGWVQEHLERARNASNEPNFKREIIESVRTINSNHVDVYTGAYTVSSIGDRLDAFLREAAIISRKELTEWLGRRKYRTCSLPDGSAWILREGNSPQPCIHIHPARTGAKHIRIQGNAWKTAIVQHLLYPDDAAFDTARINAIRKNILGVSPVRSDRLNREQLIRMFRLLSGNCPEENETKKE
ncbi:MAG TPA: hypothetical protein PLK12_16710, partial [Prolixibacteraceae bacterium]|nr:hypothetical protein [Prolixibacteraceae bacterium]